MGISREKSFQQANRLSAGLTHCGGREVFEVATAFAKQVEQFRGSKPARRGFQVLHCDLAVSI
jgi:hypothetical protein